MSFSSLQTHTCTHTYMIYMHTHTSNLTHRSTIEQSIQCSEEKNIKSVILLTFNDSQLYHLRFLLITVHIKFPAQLNLPTNLSKETNKNVRAVNFSQTGVDNLSILCCL